MNEAIAYLRTMRTRGFAMHGLGFDGSDCHHTDETEVDGYLGIVRRNEHRASASRARVEAHRR